MSDLRPNNDHFLQNPFPETPSKNPPKSLIYLASLYNAKVLLGSATPAIESYYNAMQGKFGFVELLKRYSDIKLPKVEAVDLKKGFNKMRRPSKKDVATLLNSYF